MNVVFMGTPEFAVPSLRAVADAHRITAVYTQPDRPAGRGRHLKAQRVKEVALELELSVRQPVTLRNEDEVAFVQELAPDVICVAAYGLILPLEILRIPRFGCVNVHASLLPLYRGAAPVHRAILDGQSVTGVSIMLMEEGLDTGPWAVQVHVPVGNATVDELTDTLATIGARALVDTLAAIGSDSVIWTAQDDSEATYAPKITREDVAVDPEMSLEEALRRIRVSTNRVSTRVCVGDRNITVTSASPTHLSVPQGKVGIEDGHPVIGLSDGALVLSEVRPEGRATMEGSCFMRGARLDSGCTWGPCS